MLTLLQSAPAARRCSPYNIGRGYYGSPVGSSTTSITETVTTTYSGASGFQEAANTPAVNTTSGDVTLTWSSIEGGTYQVQASPDISSWATLSGSLPAAADAVQTSYIDSGAAKSNAKRFYEATSHRAGHL